MRRIRTFSKLSEDAKAKILDRLNEFISECTESYDAMITDYDEEYIFKADVIYDVKREFHSEHEAMASDIADICDEYNFEWKEFDHLSAVIGVMIFSTPMEDIELPIRVKELIEEFKSKYYSNKENI